MARPLEPNTRDKILTLRLTLNELIAVHDAASRAGLSVSEFARERLLKAHKARKRRVEPIPGIDPELWIQVRKIGVNLNQIAHRLNAAEVPFVPPDLDGLIAHIRRLLTLPVASK